MWPFSDLVVMQDPLSKSLVQHLSVPLLESLGLGYLLVSRVAVENVVISFTGWTGPDVTRHIPEEGDKICQPLSTRRISISWKGVNCSLLTPVSSHTPGSLLRSHGTLQSLAHVVWRSEYCRGMICKPVCKANMEKLATHRGATHTTYKSKAAKKKCKHDSSFFCCSFTWYLEKGTLSRTPGHACQRNKRPPRLFPQMQKVLWFCKGRSPPSRLSPQTWGNREA